VFLLFGTLVPVIEVIFVVWGGARMIGQHTFFC
jgi:hypothetical protein